MAVFDPYNQRGSEKKPDSLANDLVSLFDEFGGDHVKLMTQLVIYVEKRDARVWQDGFKKGKKK